MEAGSRPVSRPISKRMTCTVSGKRQFRVRCARLSPGTGHEGCGVLSRNAPPLVELRVSRKLSVDILCRRIGRSRIVKPNDPSSRRHFCRTRVSLSNIGIRTCADHRRTRSLVAPVGAKPGSRGRPRTECLIATQAGRGMRHGASFQERWIIRLECRNRCSPRRNERIGNPGQGCPASWADALPEARCRGRVLSSEA